MSSSDSIAHSSGEPVRRPPVGAAGPGRWGLALLPAVALLPYGLDYLYTTPTPARTAVLAAIGLAGCAAVWWSVQRADRLDRSLERRAHAVVLGAAMLFFLAGSGLCLLRHSVFGDDLGIDTAYLTQLMWSTSHGHGYTEQVLNELTFTPPIDSHFGAHNSPFLLLLAPLSMLFPGAPALLLARNLALAATALPAFGFFRRRLPTTASLLVTLALLAQPTLLVGTFQPLTDFAFALPFLAGAVYFVDRRHLPGSILCLVLAVSVKENVALAAACIGLVALGRRGGWRWALGIGSTCLAWYAASVLWIKPHFMDGSRWIEVQGAFVAFGSTPLEVLGTILRDPLAVVRQIFDRVDRIYLLQVVRPSACAGILGTASALGIPELLSNLLQSATPANPTDLARPASLIPALAVALGAGQGAALLGRRLTGRSGDGGPAAIAVAIAILGAALAGNLDVVRPDTLRTFLADARVPAMRQALAMIPPTGSVTAPRAVLSHVAARERIYVLNDLHLYPDSPHPDYVLLDTDLDRSPIFRVNRPAYTRFVEEVLREPEYELLLDRDGVQLYRRNR